MKLALSFAWYLIQFLKLVFSSLIIILGYLLIFDSTFWEATQPNPWSENLLWMSIFVFGILALIACNKLNRSIKNIKNKLIFTIQNKKAFQFAAITTSCYLAGKHVLLFYLHSVDEQKIAWQALWNNSNTQFSEVISLGLLASFFWIIAQLISEGITYKTENDLTI